MVRHFLLFVRDVFNLSPIGPDVPPPLLGEIVRLNLKVAVSNPDELTEAWLVWWRRFVHVEGKAPEPEPFRCRLHDFVLRAIAEVCVVVGHSVARL